MLVFMRQLTGRMGLLGGVLLTLAFALPAFETHACAGEFSPPSVEASVDAPTDPYAQCPDCGPACATGCCHAPHVATAPEVTGVSRPRAAVAPAVWADIVGGPLDAPGGPERPPRL